MDFDSVLREIGPFGKFQKTRLVFLCIPAAFLCVFCNYALVFMQLTPPHWCNGSDQSVEDAVRKYRIANSSALNCVLFNNFSLPRMNETCPDGWKFDDSDKKATITTRWNFYCKDASYKELTFTVAQVGTITGVILFSHVQDVFGRRPAFFTCLTVYVLASFCSLFVPCYTGFALLRFFAALSGVPAFQIPYIIALELVGPSKRTMVTNVMAMVFAVSMACLGLLAYLTEDWFQMGLVTSIPFVVFYIYWWILDESPRWLLTQDRLSDLEKLVFKMAKTNGVHLPEHYDVLAAATKINVDLDSRNSSFEYERRQLRFWHLLRTPNLRYKTMILTWVWIANAIVYIGLQYNVEYLPGNKYLTFAVLGLTEVPAACFNWLILDRVGRILPAVFTMVFGGMASVASFFLIGKITYWQTILLVGLTKFCISSSYSIVYQLSGELFPTEARATGIGFGSVMANIGILAMPYIIASARTLQMLPMLIMGVLSLCAGFVTLLLPETLGKKLPESLDQAETVGKVGKHSLKANTLCGSRNEENNDYLNKEYLRVPLR